MSKKLFSLFTLFVFCLTITSTACGGGGGGGGNNGGGETDTGKPTVSITSPSDGATVSGTSVTLSANATDDKSGVAHVDFKVDGTTVCSASGSIFSCTWDSKTVANGTHNVTAVAVDGAGLASDPKSVSVIVNNVTLAGTWRSVNAGTTENLNGVWVDPNPTHDIVIVVGDNGTIRKWNGTTWTNILCGASGKRLFGIWGNGIQNIWIVGEQGLLIHYDGTNCWGEASPTTNNINAVWGTAYNDVYALPAGGGIIHYNGIVWSNVPYVSGSYTAGWSASSTDAWVVGFSGGMRHYNGDIWPTVNTGTTSEIFLSVWGSGPSDVWMGGNTTGMVRHWNGTTLESLPPVTNGVVSISGSGTNDVWFVGGGTISHWDGSSISTARSPANLDEHLTSVSAKSANEAWAVGWAGQVLRYSP